VAFHVEISSGFRQRARAFNLNEARLRSTIVDPWIAGRPISLGDKEWEPADCKLIVLEGPELADSDLSMGRGWSNAEKSSENVTRQLIDAAMGPSRPLVSVLAESEDAQAQMEGMLDRLEVQAVPWAELRARILAPPRTASGPGYAAVLLIDRADPEPSWLFDAGLACGALGPRAVVVQLGDSSIPEQLAGVDVIRLVPGDDASLRALGDRLTR
jgi:hypothetical protein